MAPVPVIYSSLDGTSSNRRKRSSLNLRLFLLLILPPTTLYFLISTYQPHLLSLEGLSINHCSDEDFSDGEWFKKSDSELVEMGESVYKIGGFQGCASTISADKMLGIEGDGPVTSRRKSQSSFEWRPSPKCSISKFNKETMIRSLVEKGGWLIVGGTFKKMLKSYDVSR